jgi:hypothetical protein
MDTSGSTFAPFWQPHRADEAGSPDFDMDRGDTPTQQAALEELAERVNAARTVA